MSPNVNYQSGRRFEYGRRKHWMKRNYICLRTAGSHGQFDLLCLRPYEPPILIQCKRTQSLSTAKSLARKFAESPPLPPCKAYKQVMEISVKGSSEVISTTI